jgi:diaminopimelate epimerase
MRLTFHKYHALGNDFIVFDPNTKGISARRLPELAKAICHRGTGVGADGILWLSTGGESDCRVDIYNADGSWAEKSGNGLRITALHLAQLGNKQRSFVIETGTSRDWVQLVRKIPGGYLIRAELGEPKFDAADVPVKSKQPFVINSQIKIGSIDLPMTCVAIGNPHAVIVVDNFDFDWQALGAEIETAKSFPNGTNVEFVRPTGRKKLQLREFERGVGPTESSGTGAAAAVCAMVVMGLADRQCEVEFEAGTLAIDWNEETNLVALTGPVEFVMRGEFDF